MEDQEPQRRVSTMTTAKASISDGLPKSNDRDAREDRTAVERIRVQQEQEPAQYVPVAS